ncbi:choline transport protein [Penicillium chermesinum]|uniref:Choline transport protein n=1 Tax=Penicillium chermesinum TaxID=63820 RepID=A0A9W9P872_9EURO|nr:choline transport protein [Penicillium chermesinum]KAJ5239321.1 choline transport protein [Penicillium chermesinum]KAJ6164948.1 choline transport protein [Penicillium chermesinum]
MDMEMRSLGPADSRSGSVVGGGKTPVTSTKASGDTRDRDAYELARAGKKDVLKRRFSLTSTIGFTCSLMLTWEAIMMNLSVGLENGGPAGLVYGFIGVWIGFISVVTVLGELASMMPAAGGQYHWTAILAPQSAKRFLSYITGCICVVAWIAAPTAAIYLASSVLQTTIATNIPSYEPKGWQVTLIMWAVLAVITTMSTILGMVLPVIEVFILFIHVFGFFAVLIPVLYLGPRSSTKAVWSTSFELGGWNDITLATFIGMKGAVASFLGTDGAVHMAEEVANSSTVVPHSMIAAILINGGLAFGVMLTFLYAAGDIMSILKSSSPYPFIQIIENATQSKSAAVVLSSMVCVLQACAGLAGVASGARMLWSFSREQAVPGWQWVSQVSKRFSIPIHSTLVVVICSSLLSLINIGSETVLNIVLSLVLQAFFSSYIISLSLLLYRRLRGEIMENGPDVPKEIVAWGPFRVKGWLGVANNIFAIVFSVIMMFFGSWPATKHPAPEQVNYSIAIFVGWTLLFVLYYLFWAKKRPIWTAVHPCNGHTPEDRARDFALDADIRWAASQKNPASTLIYAIDKETGEVAGGCEWLIFHENPFPNGPQPMKCTWYPAGSERAEYAERMLNQAFFARQAWFQRPHAGVNAMGVHPKYRRRGVGRLLMEWGHKIIDPLGYESFTEGSPIGRWLYEQYGYRRVMGLHVDFDKPNPSDEWRRLMHECKAPGILLLWRPPRGEWTEKVPTGPWAVTPETFK